MRHAASVVLWLCITPLGLPVVPDVNAIRITVSASMVAGTKPAGGPLAAATSSRPTMPGSGVPRTMPIVGERRQPRRELRRHGGVIEVAKRPAADEHLAAGEAHDVFELAAAEVDADGDRHRAEALQREEHERELDPVRQLDGDDVAGADAERAQARRHAIDAVGELAIA